MLTSDEALNGTARRLTCMEVWGGNSSCDTKLSTAGLDLWVYSQAHGGSARGGDVYYTSSCASGNISRVLLADISGHGATVTDLAQKLRDLMRKHVNHVAQSALVEAINREFAGIAHDGGFATAAVGTFFAPTRGLSLSLAGHPPPIVFRAGTGTWSVVELQQPTGLPWGVDAASAYAESSMRLEPDDLLFCYSDAFLESRDGSGAPLMVDGLLDVVQSLKPCPAPEFIGALRSRLTDLRPENLSTDDATALLLQATGESGRLRDLAMAPFRMFRS
jgi:serine phosphatase RsbU (regulator of sigma subunit)